MRPTPNLPTASQSSLLPPAGMRTSLLLGLVLLAASASAAEPKPTPWAELVPVPAKLPAARPKPLAEVSACQPENFIPGETPLGKRVSQSAERATYAFDDGVELEVIDERKKAKPGQLASVTYRFSCASSSDEVLDYYRNGRRHALYQHVWEARKHPTKPLYFWSQAERKQGRYYDFRGLLHLQTKRKVPLPELGCVYGRNGFFSGDRLVTYGEAYAAKDRKTDVCVWSLDGKLQARVLADLYFAAASDYQLVDEVGLLPKQPDVFYAVHNAFTDNPDATGCELRLQSLKRPELSRRIPVGEKCRGSELGLDKVTLQAP